MNTLQLGKIWSFGPIKIHGESMWGQLRIIILLHFRLYSPQPSPLSTLKNCGLSKFCFKWSSKWIHTIISAGDGQHTCANHQHGSPIKMTLTTTAPMCYTWPRKVKCGLKGQVFGWSWFAWQESLTVTSENLWQGEQGWDLAVQVSGSGLVTNIE